MHRGVGEGMSCDQSRLSARALLKRARGRGRGGAVMLGAMLDQSHGFFGANFRALYGIDFADVAELMMTLISTRESIKF